MYYFVKFTYKNEIMEADPDVMLLPCEWVVKADSKEEAIEQIKKDIELDEILEECDDAFFAYEDDLNELNYSFVMKNKEQFS